MSKRTRRNQEGKRYQGLTTFKKFDKVGHFSYT